jgi:hypothetical protein
VNRWLFNKNTVDRVHEHVMIRAFAAVKEEVSPLGFAQ